MKLWTDVECFTNKMACAERHPQHYGASLNPLSAIGDKLSSGVENNSCFYRSSSQVEKHRSCQAQISS